MRAWVTSHRWYFFFLINLLLLRCWFLMCFSAIAQIEDLLTEILLRLPVKPLSRFKCVSKQWRKLISDPRYLTSHRFPASSLVLSYTPEHLQPTLNIVPLTSSSDANASPPTVLNFGFLNVPNLPLEVKVRQSCNGLLLVQGTRTELSSHDLTPIFRYFVCNPITKRFVTFEATNSSFFLVYDPLRSLHFKAVSVLQVKDFGSPDTCLLDLDTRHEYYTYKITIYSSETGSWTDLGDCLTAPSYMRMYSGVYCNGAIHWCTEAANNSLYFDVENQCLKTYPMPPNFRHEYYVKYFGESRGHLHMILQSHELSLFDILELDEDYSGWSMRFRVDLSAMQVAFPESILELEEFEALCIVHQEKEGESMLVFVIDDTIFSYNLLGATFRVLSEFLSNWDYICALFEYHENLSWVEGFTA